MFTDILQPTHLLFVLVVALLVLGPKRLPEVARSLGNGLRDFRAAISGESKDDEVDQPGHYMLEDEHADDPAQPGDAPAATAAPADTAIPASQPTERPGGPSASKPQPRR